MIVTKSTRPRTNGERLNAWKWRKFAAERRRMVEAGVEPRQAERDALAEVFHGHKPPNPDDSP